MTRYTTPLYRNACYRSSDPMLSISDLHGLHTTVRTHVGDAATDGEGARPGRGTASVDRHRRYLLRRKEPGLGCAKSDYSKSR
jgi:hypothetical protein